MKKYLYLFPFVFLSACSSFLEVEPRTSISGDQVINDETSAKAALNGVYAALRSYYSVNYQSIAYLSGDNVEWTGSQSQIQEFINHKVNAENATLATTWNGIYKSIDRANNVIQDLTDYDQGNISDALKENLRGQAYAIRALNYFDLLRVWGGVPIVTAPTTKIGENMGIRRSSADQVYARVLEDLDTAEGLLDNSTDRTALTKKSVLALKARYYLYRQDWQRAIQYADRLLSDPDYELLDPYDSFFKNDVTETRESIFELFYSANEPNPHRGQWQPQTNGGTRQWAPNAALVKLLSSPETGGARAALIARDNQGRWYGNLYYRDPAKDPTYIVRIAEILLIRAEASAELGDYTQALTDLNRIRSRAALKARPSSTDKDQILSWIADERRLEFTFEAHRWFDLVRTGRAKQVLGIQEDFRLLLPIPYSQLLADPALEQNPGYSR
ncbi:RagB/SusD family nutrient uptake outer membrane protein [Sphingobacterium sp. N143]|uniref:RagB/SusD family nutrient uptake outer membrane protein n=1 Tax=Sphingobacterium sp. N143 TaxID=2746727 RepID=UPI002574ADE0|nr:RagB/SusD family nutrient uptake outer membrane protein [Sphingobacterium sp. N143]MDM1296494.1 RagB/SusD family nutrient uptake outer membrane protein [Sphingobacterium sp. N143]